MRVRRFRSSPAPRYQVRLFALPLNYNELTANSVSQFVRTSYTTSVRILLHRPRAVAGSPLASVLAPRLATFEYALIQDNGPSHHLYNPGDLDPLRLRARSVRAIERVVTKILPKAVWPART